ncbi:MAG: methyltransferase [Acidocella sp.]|nr:methyltransferase [Acidocella sp.]
MSQITEGTLLGGKVTYRQFASGHRSGFEPVLLAASVNAKPGELVLEAGSGAGAALLCLGHRVPGLSGTGIEIDPTLVTLANENFKINGLNGMASLQGDAARPPFGAIFQHAIANPPWFNPASTKSPDEQRALAHHSQPGLLAAWINGLTNCLHPRGRIYLILPAASVSDAIIGLKTHKYGAITLFPLWPRAGQAAGQIILTARRGSRAADQCLPGLILHDENGITTAANAILRDGTAISMD